MDPEQPYVAGNQKVEWSRLQWVIRQVNLLRVVEAVMHFNLATTWSVATQLRHSQLATHVLAGGTHAVVQPALLLHDLQVLLLPL